MNLFVFFSSFFVLQKIYNKKLLGDDERFIYHPDQFNDNITLAKIIYLYNIKNKLDLLESNDVSVLRKLDEIDEIDEKLSSIAPLNVLRGGLLNDWNFDFPIE